MAHVIPIIRSIDGFGLTAGCGRDQNLNELVGATVKIDIDYVKNNPKPDIPTTKKQLITEAEPETLATFDGKVFCVAGTNYVADPGTGQETLDLWKERVKQIQICYRCLSEASHDYSLLTSRGDICSSSCQNCLKGCEVCGPCKLKGHTSIDPNLRPCDKCITLKE